MITLAIIALFLIVAMLIGGIFAYFTKTETVTNTFTIGNVNITLTEPNWTNGVNAAKLIDENAISPANATNMVPGDTCEKDPTVTNTGANPAYVFMKVEIPHYNNEDLFTLTGVNSAWKQVSSTTSGATTTKIYALASAAALNVVVTAYAIQDNIDTSAAATDTQAEVFGLFTGN